MSETVPPVDPSTNACMGPSTSPADEDQAAGPSTSGEGEVHALRTPTEAATTAVAEPSSTAEAKAADGDDHAVDEDNDKAKTASLSFLEADTDHMTNSRKSPSGAAPAKSNSFPSTLTDSNEERDLPLESDHQPTAMDAQRVVDVEEVSLSLSIPSRFKVVQVPSSLPSSLNSSFVTFDEHTIEDIRNLVLVDDDTHATPSREVSLSPPRTTTRKRYNHNNHHRTPVVRNTSGDSQQRLQSSHKQRLGGSPMPMHQQLLNAYDDDLQNPNAQHERADCCPVRPMRGMSIGSMDSEHIRAALNGNNNQSSNTFPSMWEDSWTTFATMDNLSHHGHGPAAVIMEEMAEETEEGEPAAAISNNSKNYPPHNHNNLLSHSPPPPPVITDAPYSPNRFKNAYQQQQHQHLQQPVPQRTHQLTIPKRSSSIQSGAGIGSRKATPRRTSSRNSQYSAFSNMSSLDASVIRRISRSERINRLKRKSMQQHHQHVASSSASLASANSNSSLIANYNKQPHHNANSIASSTIDSAEGYNSLSSNSKIPERRPTKVLPPDLEAEQEPKSFWGHSSSQLSLTSSSEEEDSDHDGDDEHGNNNGTAAGELEDGADMTPRLPGRRNSASSMSLYEAEAAAIRLQEAHDLPLMAPLRRTSTFGSQTDLYLSHARGDDIESDLEEMNSSSHHEESRGGGRRPPISSIHLPPQQQQSTQQQSSANNATTTTTTTFEAAEDHVPKAPARQRSLPRSSNHEETKKWLQYASAATTDDLPLQLDFPPQPLSVLSATSSSADSIPSRPKRQTTLTKESIPKRKLRGEQSSSSSADKAEDNDKDDNSKKRESDTSSNSNSNSEEKENASNSSLSLSSSQHNGSSSRHHHRRTNSADAAPNQPTRQSSKSRPLSPAVIMLAQSTLDDSKELLLLNKTERGDDVKKTIQTLQRECNTENHQNGTTCPICEASSSSLSMTALHNTSSATTMSCNKPPTLDAAGRIGSVTSISTGATTECANNTRMGRRMLPCRHFTRGSSLRSAAASLQNGRNSTRSLGVEDLANNNANNPAATLPESPVKRTGAQQQQSSSATMSPGTELEQLKLLNDDTMRDLGEQLMNGLKIDGSNNSTNNKPASTVQVPTHASGLGSSTSSLLAELLGGNSDHSEGTAWSSATKEFEQLKLMHDDTVADLETQLQLLEQQEQEEEDEDNFQISDADLSRASEELIKEASSLNGSNNSSSLGDNSNSNNKNTFAKQTSSSIGCPM